MKSNTTNMFKRMNAKDKKKFNKLSLEEKTDILQHEVNKKVMEQSTEIITNAFAQGVATGIGVLAEKYVVEMLETKDDERKQELLQQLIVEMMRAYEQYKELGIGEKPYQEEKEIK